MGCFVGNGIWESDTTPIVLQCEYDNRFVHGDSGDWFEKDMSGQWWVDENGGGELGPFNTLEHACECVAWRYEHEGEA